MQRWGVFWMVIWLFVPAGLWAQEDRPMLTFQFTRQNDFTFSSQLLSNYRFDQGAYHLKASLLNSNIFNTVSEGGSFVQLYMKSLVWQHYDWRKRWAWASMTEADLYFASQNRKVSQYFGMTYRPDEGIEITPLIGYSWDMRTAILGRTEPFLKVDRGWSPAMLIDVNREWEAEKLSMETKIFARYKFIDPRRQRNLVFRQDWAKQFAEGVQINAGLQVGSHELDDYQGNSVKRILSDSLAAHLNLNYVFSSGLEWRSRNRGLLTRRAFRFEQVVGPEPEENDLVFDGLGILSQQRLTLQNESWRTSVQYEFAYDSRTYLLENNLGLNDPDYRQRLEQEKQKDFLRNQHKWDFSVRFLASPGQRLELILTNQYLQYDSPSETNFDDRDELNWLGRLEWGKQWPGRLMTKVSVSGNYRHYAFLNEEKSQDNYIQRSLRLDFRYDWDPHPHLRLEGNNAIYVTYNVKDFADFNKTDRSTRNLETNLKTTYQPHRKFQSVLQIRRKEIHQSYLNWARFTESTLDTNRILTIEEVNTFPLLQKKKGKSLRIEGGYRHFQQTKKFLASTIGVDHLLKGIRLRQVNSQTGPTVGLSYHDLRGSSINLNLWLQVQVQKYKYSELNESSFSGMTYQKDDLDSVQKEIRPYPSIKFLYTF